MDRIVNILKSIKDTYTHPVLNTNVILSVLAVVLLLSLYLFIVYRFVSHRAFYNKAFNICLAAIPFFISTIILCLQSNIVITLGTIGALAIIRFRTAIKDPVDMLYILWAIHIGITCGCQLYEVAVLTSIAVTIILLVLENVSLGRKPLVLIFHCDAEQDKAIFEVIKKTTKRYTIKSRSCTAKGMDYVVELSAKNVDALTDSLRNANVDKFSIIAYDCDDVI